MVDNNPDSAHSNPKKSSNPFKKILDDVKKFMKKEEEEKKPSSFETLKKEKNQASNQELRSSNIPKLETPETKEAEKSARVRKAKVNEQRLPKKYKKGW